MENLSNKSSEIDFLVEKIDNEEVLNSADYIEFKKNVERLLKLIEESDPQYRRDLLMDLGNEIRTLKNLEQQEDKYSKILNNTGIGAVGLAAILGALSVPLLPIISASVVGALSALTGFTYKFNRDKKEIEIAKSISSKIRELVSSLVHAKSS